MWVKSTNLVFRAAVTAACLSYVHDKWWTPPASIQNTADIITGSIEHIPETGLVKNDRLEDKLQGQLSSSPEKDQEVFKIILAQAEVKRSQSGPAIKKPEPPTKVNQEATGNSGPAIKAQDSQVAPDFDPNFDEWQKQADEKLKTENASINIAEHPLAASHPDSYIVVCMAGCRPSSDVITYKVSKVAASAKAIAERRMQLTGVSVDGKPVTAGNGIVCVAGCYDDEGAGSPPKKKQAEAAEPKSKQEPVRAADIIPSKKAIKIVPFASVSRQLAHLISGETRVRLSKKRIKSFESAKLPKSGSISLARLKRKFEAKKLQAAKLAKPAPQYASHPRIGARSRLHDSRKVKVLTEASGFIF